MEKQDRSNKNVDSEEFINRIIMTISDAEPKSKSDLKCAPGVKFEAGSCISLAILEEMANAWNQDLEIGKKNQEDSIVLSKNLSVVNPKKYKIYLIHELGKRIGDTCTSQKCWSTLEFVKRMKKVAREELYKHTFRPDSPQGKFDWLSTFDIVDTMKQYEKKFKDFLFWGAVPMDFGELDTYSHITDADYDEIIKKGKTKIGVIFNLDESYKSGSHWVALYIDLNKGCIFYFDSFGVKPEKRVRSLMRKTARYLIDKKGMSLSERSDSDKSLIDDLNKDSKDKNESLKSERGTKKIRIDYNNNQHQHKNTECGVYSMNFLIRMARGDDFDDLCANAVSDDQINKCRNIYFDTHTKKRRR